MAYLLDAAYLILLAAATPWLLLRAVRTGRYRQGWGQKLLGLAPRRDSPAPCAWIHAVSLGEVSLIAPLIAEFKRRHPTWEIAISTTTLTGYTLARARYSDHRVFYCPLDFSWAVRRAVARIRPRWLILAELELWPNLIAAARRSGAKVAVVNGRLSDRSFRGYARFGGWLRSTLDRLDLVAAQNPQYAERFLQLGVADERVFVTGSLKFDGAQTDRNNASTLRLRSLAGFMPEDIVLLAGSTQDPEEQLAIDSYQRLAVEHPRLRLIVVPRHPERFEVVAQLLTARGLAWQRRSTLDQRPVDPAARVLLVDRVGELAAWWGTARIAYVGGSMGKRNGQNMIEPAAYGAAVAFGPKTHNFRDVVAALLAAEAAVVVPEGEALAAFVRRCLEEPAFADELGARAARVVASQLGAAARTVDLLDALEAAPSCQRAAQRSAA